MADKVRVAVAGGSTSISVNGDTVDVVDGVAELTPYQAAQVAGNRHFKLLADGDDGKTFSQGAGSGVVTSDGGRGASVVKAATMPPAGLGTKDLADANKSKAKPTTAPVTTINRGGPDTMNQDVVAGKAPAGSTQQPPNQVKADETPIATSEPKANSSAAVADNAKASEEKKS